MPGQGIFGRALHRADQPNRLNQLIRGAFLSDLLPDGNFQGIEGRLYFQQIMPGGKSLLGNAFGMGNKRFQVSLFNTLPNEIVKSG